VIGNRSVRIVRSVAIAIAVPISGVAGVAIAIAIAVPVSGLVTIARPVAVARPIAVTVA
jgi:hypothetical protein